jgi:hypothetical protein
MDCSSAAAESVKKKVCLPFLSLKKMEMPIGSRRSGLAISTLRVRFNHPNIREELRSAFVAMYEVYGPVR